MPVSGSAPAQKSRYVAQETWDRASLARRLSAWLIDFALLVAVVLVVASLLGLAQPRQGSWTDIDGSTVTASGSYLPTQWLQLLLAVASALYTIPLWRLTRATLGQRLLGLRVFDLEVPKALSWRQAAIRWLFLYGWTIPGMLSTIPALTWICTLVFLAWFAELIVSTRRGGHGIGIHDRFARSQVRRQQWYKVVAPRAAKESAAPPAQAALPAEDAAPALPPETPPQTPTEASRDRRRSTRGRPAKD
jgi:uncharacterized RDD family membrane protein YckC